MAVDHVSEAGPATVHRGYFEAARRPVVEIDSGERITIRTVSGGADVTPERGFSVPPALREI